MDNQSLKMTLAELSYIAGRAGFVVIGSGTPARVDILMKWAIDFEIKHYATDWEEHVWDDEVWFHFVNQIRKDKGTLYRCPHDVNESLPAIR